MTKNISTDDLLSSIIKGIEDVKGLDIDILDLRGIDNSVCDYFVICNGNSNTQVNAIVGSVQKGVSKELKDKPWHIEGTDVGEWVLMDYAIKSSNVILHDIGSFDNAPGEGPAAWQGSGGIDLVAHANDIIQYNGTNWTVSFDSHSDSTLQYVSNLTTGTQYKWNGTQWVKSWEGEYKEGLWTLVI